MNIEKVLSRRKGKLRNMFSYFLFLFPKRTLTMLQKTIPESK